MARLPTLLVPLLISCNADKSADSGRAGDGGAAAGDGGTDPAATDDDRDGYLLEDDCDDHNYQVFPGAPELCDGLDNDCDEDVDEGWDQDGDGALPTDDCAAGTDCDDSDPSVYGGSAEVPYDGVDQDCDGADLSDVDGDGFTAAEAGGNDCDDSDPLTCPNCAEAAADGIDQDCDGLDLLDGDGDGHDDLAVGGDDCDDTDAGVHPGALDLMNDGLDQDCDGVDGAPLALASAAVSIDGDPLFNERMGSALAACDLDEDGRDDLIVGVPQADGMRGAVGIWYGAGSGSWTAGMTTSDADALFTSDGFYFGDQARCGDVDGDGHKDLIIGRDQFTNDGVFAEFDTDLGLYLFYGDGRGWSGAVDAEDYDALFEFDLGQQSSVFVYGMATWLYDLDGDGRDEVLTSMIDNGNPDGSSWTSSDLLSSLWVLQGGDWSGVLSWEEQLAARIGFDAHNALISVTGGGDLDGDGAPDLLMNQGYYSADPDSGELPGRLSVLSGLPEGTTTAAARAWLSIDGVAAEQLGAASMVADLDGDGAADGLLSAPLDATGGLAGGGTLYVVHDLGALPSGTGLAAADLATTTVHGAVEEGQLGLQALALGDLDLDGADDVLVTEPYGGADGLGRAWVLSGLLLTGEALQADDVALLRLDYEADYGSSDVGQQVEAGDFDGDGRPDLVIGARKHGATATSGRVYVVLSGGR